MTQTKKTSDPKDAQKVAGKDDKAQTPVKTGDAVKPGSAPAPATKRPLGTKEVIPFEWKLVGIADNMALTLFKAVERDDVEAQCERVRNEGYYKDLRVMELAAKVEQPKSAKRKKPVSPTAAKTAKTSKEPKAKPAKPAKPKHAAKAATRSTGRATTNKKSTKKSARTVKKKAASSKKTTKRTSRKSKG